MYKILFLLTMSVAALQADAFPVKPPKDITLLKGYGQLHHPVTTKSPEAQKFFDQGLTMIYAFNLDGAYWSFQKAADIDPDLAMAYWGMALALGQNLSKNFTSEKLDSAFNLIQKAIQISNPATENEKDYINALAARYTNDPKPDVTKLVTNYNEAMKGLSKKYPYDPDATALYVASSLDLNRWHQWSVTGEPLKGTWEIVDLLERGLRWVPDHVGLNHYYVHTIEASKYPERGLASADRLRKLLPASGHLLHMPSHIYFLLGDYHTAALSNEEAVKADEAYIYEYGTQGAYPVHYLAHNLFFLTRAYAMEGRYNDALKTAKKLQDFYNPHFDAKPNLEEYVTAELFTLLRFHKWKEVIDLPAPANEKMATSTVFWHFGRALAFTALGDKGNAEKEKALFKEAAKKVPPSSTYGYNDVSLVFKIAELQLNAKTAEMAGDHTNAISLLTEAATEQDKLSYNEPPDWYFPIREALGGVLLRHNMNFEAALAFNSDLEKHPRNGRSLFGLYTALQNQKKTTDPYWIKTEFDKAWQYSDSPLSVNDL